MVAAKNSKLLLWLRILQKRKKRKKMNILITSITLRRRRLRNLLFLLLQNEALSQWYDRIRSHHKKVLGDIWGIVVGSPMLAKAIVMEGSKLFQSFKRNIHQYPWFYSQWSTTRIPLWNSNFSRTKARNVSVPPGPWRLLPNYIRANRPWDSDSKKYYSRSIKPYCNQTLEKICCFPKNWRRIFK